MKILLASQSPRRKELLESLGYPFEVVSINLEEVYPQDLPVQDIAGYLAELKANAYTALEDDEILLTADTIVVADDEILGKPKNRGEAENMLRRLSDRVHRVYTGICLRHKDRTITKTDVAEVFMSSFSDEEIDYYIDKFQPYDKAGAYGVQEWIGMAKINRIEGSFYTIMGLPTHLVYSVLKDMIPKK
ncbi:Maf family protein [Riemerella columbipharyngis]|uniref:dTTP/UTP pyrophosphatase n=1 Tax=Riemerella columbipharyngis TaxID=1071918 RepID=A0A1G7ES15_9FLAO|nr:Maf family nucleotide pyrophosphatase [Riemerella columbipharyngis]SDE66407.1 septum formation protein [Riemerella columbipharyngis]